MLKIDENKLVLSKELVMLLQANPGDKIAIEYSVNGNTLIPVILKSDRGNVLNKSNTVSFKGKQRESLLQFGTEFQVEVKDNVLTLIGDKGTVVYTAVPETTFEEPLDKSIILDTNYNIQKFDKYEL
jgi:hypothetical protein